MLLACVLLGAGLVAEDRRANALELYLSRPMSLLQYLTGRLLTIGTFVAAVSVVPAGVLVLTQLSLDWTKPGEAARLGVLFVRTLGAGAVWVLVPSLLILATSSLCERARNAAIVFLGIVVLLEFVASTSCPAGAVSTAESSATSNPAFACCIRFSSSFAAGTVLPAMTASRMRCSSSMLCCSNSSIADVDRTRPSSRPSNSVSIS
jgi:ABC-type transport system involved in multi-copper enzyme maturation permease subunit